MSLLLRRDVRALLALTTALSTAAHAQDTTSLEEVTVTGSRIHQDGFQSATPTTVVGSDLLENMGVVNVGDAVGLIPQNSQFFSDTNVGNGNFNVGAELANLRGLNPFFGTRTLTLLNTRRHVPTTTGGGVDLSLIPSVLVSRIETITGGASAAYGSDAVAGVVNILLDTGLEGVKAQLDYGRPSSGDGDDYHIGVGGGWSFADGRGHIILGGEYQDTGAIDDCTSRSWCTNADALFTNQAFAAGNGFPNYMIGPDAKINGSTQTGVIGGAFGAPSVQLNEAGTALIPFDKGRFGGAFPGTGNRQGGDGENIGPYDYRQLRPENERYSLLTHIDYELTDDLQGFLELSYASTDAVSESQLNANATYFAGSRVYADNYYLNQAGIDITPFLVFGAAPFARDLSNLRQGLNETSNEVYRFAVGLDGDLFNSDTWTWDVYSQFGRNENNQRVHNWQVNDNTGAFAGTTNGGPFGTGRFDYFDWALDVVDDGAGNPVCREVLLGNPEAAGCLPLNLFGLNNADQAAIDYAYRTLIEDGTFEQQVVAGAIQGTLFDGWGAGPVAMAAGLEYRKEEGNVTHGNDPFRYSFALSYGNDYSGELEVTEGFVEFDVPVLQDAPFAEMLALNMAARKTKNETHAGDTGIASAIGRTRSVDFTSWKVSAIYDPVGWLRIRGTRSQDVRAAAFRELYFSYDGTLAQQGTLENPWTGDQQDASRTVLGGNFGLRPEVADTKTLGFVLSPGGFATGLQLSADWYEIDLVDSIASFGIGANAILLGCFTNSSSQSCEKIEGVSDGAGGFSDIQTVYNTADNVGSALARGVDVEVSYAWSLGQSGDSLSLRLLASNLYDQIIDPGTGAGPQNYRGQSGPAGLFGGFNSSPEWQSNVFLNYSNGSFSGSLQARYAGSGSYAVLQGGNRVVGPDSAAFDPVVAGSIDDNTLPSRTYFTLSGSYDFDLQDSSLQLFGVINNVFDRDPPIAPGGNGFPTNPVYFDTLGRNFRVGVRMEF